MRLQITKVHIRGFLSVGESSVELSDKGLTLISGENKSPDNQSSNGSGKSAIFESIIFALTGNTMRGTKDVVNKFMKDKYTDVTLEFLVDNTEYKVRRTREHPEHGNNLFIIKDGVDISGDKLTKSEQILKEELPRLSQNILSSVIILGQGLPNKFTSLTPLKRKERLEELAETNTFITKLRSDISDSIKSITQQMTTTKIEEATIKSRLETNRLTLHNKSADLVKFNESASDIEDLRSRSTELRAQLDDQDRIKSELQSQLSLLNMEWNTNLTELNSARNQLSNIKQEGSSLFNQRESLINGRSCNTCGRPFDASTQTHIDNSIISLDGMISDKSSEMARVTDELFVLEDKTNQSKARMDELNSKIINLPSTVSLASELNNVSKRITEYEVMTTSITDEIKALKTSISNDEASVEVVINKLVELTTTHTSLGYLDKLAKKEFRSYMLQGVVNYVNTKMKEYNEQLSGNRNINLIMEKDKLEITYNGTYYESLSGGERQRCDLAVQFSLRDMLMNHIGFSCDLLGLDEIFDNLDESGTTSVINLISSMTSLGTIGVISHHPSIPLPYDNKITAYKNEDRVTTIY